MTGIMLLSLAFTLSCLLVAVSAQIEETVPPSAHIEGGDPRPVDYPEDKVIASWNQNHPKSHLKNGFTFDGSHLIVPASGLYYVYVQLYFNAESQATTNRVGVFTDQSLLLMIHKSMEPNTEETATAGGVFQLNKGQRVFVKPLKGLGSVKMWLGPNHTYFGLFKINY